MAEAETVLSPLPEAIPKPAIKRSPSPVIKKERETSAMDEDAPPAEPAPKRARLDRGQDKRRGQRMFGMLMGTLNKVKEEANKEEKTEKAKRRASLENRLQTKLRTESIQVEKERELQTHERQLRLAVTKKEEELLGRDETLRLRHSSQLSLCRFLHTGSSSSSSLPPHAQPPSNSTSSPPPLLYYLPYKLLDSQRDWLDRQRETTEKTVRREKREWEEDRVKLEEDLSRLKRERDQGLRRLKETEEERQAEVKRETERDVEMDGRSDSRPWPRRSESRGRDRSAAPKDDDEEMKDAGDEARKQSEVAEVEKDEPMERANSAIVAGGDGDEALEY